MRVVNNAPGPRTRPPAPRPGWDAGWGEPSASGSDPGLRWNLEDWGGQAWLWEGAIPRPCPRLMPLGGETEVRAPRAEESQELGQVSGVDPGLSDTRVYPRKELSSSRTLTPGTSSLGEHLALAFPSFSGRRLRGRNFWSGGCRRGLPEVDPEFCRSGRKGVGNRIVFCQNGLLKTLTGAARSPKAPACRRISSTESWSGR